MSTDPAQAHFIRDFTNRYTRKDNRLATLSLVLTLAVYFATLFLALEAMWTWWAAPPRVLNAFAAVRLYVIQHDCGHWSHSRQGGRTTSPAT